ncbi:MAG: hypothetical protein QW667_03855 [Candidatus Bathyarchaeia archaeon]
MANKEELFKRCLLEAVDEGLLILGDSGRKAIYFHLQKLHSLKREDIPNNPEAFAKGLREIFGVGAEVIEKAIIKVLYDKLGLKFEERKGYTFREYLRDCEQLLRRTLRLKV